LLIVATLFLVLATVQFDYQPCFKTHKIRDVGADGHLSAEFVAVQLPLT
jgi:hypothetical protein